MADHLLKQLDTHAPHGSDGVSNTVRIRNHDVIRNASGFSRSETKEAKPKASSQSLHPRPTSQQSTSSVSLVSQVSNHPSYENTSTPSSAAQSKPLHLPPKTEALYLKEIFAENQPKSITKVELPRLQQRIERTDQLVYCNTLLLQDSNSPPTAVSGKATTGEIVDVLQGRPLDKAELAWLDEVKKDSMEADRLRWLTTRMIEQFVAVVNKDSNKVAEIVALGPILQKEPFRKLLSTFISEFEDTRILDVDILQGLVQLVQVASPGHLVSDDLIKILSIIRVRLEGTHQHSTEHSYHLTLAVSRILDVMADHKVQDVARVLEHEPLSTVLSGLKGSSDPYLMYQACYAFQALQYVPDDETALHAVLRHSTDVAMGLIKISSVLKLDLSSVLDGLASMCEALESTIEVAGSTYEGVCSLMESGRGVLDILKEGFGSGQKRPWYPAVKAAYAFAQAGQLKDLKELTLEAPCRCDPLFQWGICQLLGEIAVDPIRPTATRQQAISLLDHLYRDDQEWGRDESVKAWMLSTVTNIENTTDQAVNAIASSLLQELKQNRSISIMCRYPLSTRLPIPDTSSLLAEMQDIPYLEYKLHRLRLERLEEAKLPVYIPPMAKASLQARDDDLFPLMDKVQEFLTSDRQVMLILGDSGAGKSTFNKHLEVELLTSYKRGGPIPLFINLPAIDRAENNLVAEHLRTNNFSEEQIKELKQYRQFILICDGYDESQQKINLHRTNTLNQPGQWNAKMIISCRSQYLGQDYRSRFMPQASDHYHLPNIDLFQEAVIAPFSTEQIENYIEQYVPLEPRTWAIKDYMNKLTTIPNLMDLVRTPFLLLLALESLPLVTEGRQDLMAINITRVQLYDIFVEHWLNVNKRRLESNVLSTEDRDVFDQLVDVGFAFMGIDYLTRLATAIFEKQGGNPIIRYIHLKDKNTWRVDFFGPDPEVRLMRESSPLTRSGSLFQFLHRSMQEYFYSRTIFDPNSHGEYHEFPPQPNSGSSSSSDSQILDAESVLFKRNLLTEPSIIQFLCERVKQYPDFQERLLSVIEQSKSDATAATAAANAITILVRAGVRFNSADLRGIRIPGADLSDGQFDSTQFQGADLTGVNFSRSWLRQADFSNALIEGVHYGELPYLEEEYDCIETCTLSSDGRMLAVCLRSGGIEMYDTTSWTKIPGLGRRKHDVFRVAFSPDNEHFVSTNNKNSIRLWDITSGETLHVMQGQTYSVKSVAFSPCGTQVASSNYDGTVRLWSSETGKEMFDLKGHTDSVKVVKYAPVGRRLVSGSVDGTVRFWDAEIGNPGPVCDSHLGEVLSLGYSPDGRRVASGQNRGDICLWDADSGDLLFTFHSILRDVESVAFSPDGQWIVSSGYNPIVVVYDSTTGLLVSMFSGHTHRVDFCTFSPDGLQIVSKDIGGIVRLWDANSRTTTPPNLDRDAGGVSTVAYSLDGRSIISYIRGHAIRRLDTSTGASETIAISMDGVCSFALSPDGLLIATGNDKGIIQMWNSQTGVAERTLVGETDSADMLVYSPCGRWILSSHQNKSVRLWDLHDAAGQSHLVSKPIDLWYMVSSADIYLAFSPVGDQFVIGKPGRRIHLFNPQSEDLCSPVKEMTCALVYLMVYSPDGQHLTIGSKAGTLRFWNLQSETTVVELEGHTNKVSCITYSPCGRWLLSGSDDRTIRLWHLRAGEVDDSWSCVAVVHGCSESINCLAWNPVVPMEFVSGCKDGSVRVWKISIGDDGGVERVRMLWGKDVGRLCVSDLMFKGAVGVSPMSQRLLMQRGAVDNSF